MQVILELDDCSIRVYRSFAEHIQYNSSFSHDHLIHALNHCYQVGQYLKHHAQKRPKILKLCLRVSHNSGIILSKMFTYYSQNYAGVIGMRVSPGCVFPHTHIPRDACFPAHISLGMRVSHQ